MENKGVYREKLGGVEDKILGVIEERTGITDCTVGVIKERKLEVCNMEEYNLYSFWVQRGKYGLSTGIKFPDKEEGLGRLLEGVKGWAVGYIRGKLGEPWLIERVKIEGLEGVLNGRYQDGYELKFQEVRGEEFILGFKSKG